MSVATKNFFQAIKDIKAKKAPQNSELMSLMIPVISMLAGAMNVAQIQEMNKLLQKMKQLLLLKEISTIKPAIGSLEKPSSTENAVEEPNQTREAMFLGLEKLTTSKMCPVLKKRLFLLHRPTVEFEYNQSKKASTAQSPEPQEVAGTQGADNTETYPDYETKKDTEWLVDAVVAEKNRNGKNPIVAAWIPETSITDVSGSQQGIGAWGDLGANTEKDIVSVSVKPGNYKIYSELKA